MPQNIIIAAFVFGAILILIALLGGGFKIFGTEISGTTGRPGRIAAGVIGTFLMIWGLLNSLPNVQPFFQIYSCQAPGKGGDWAPQPGDIPLLECDVSFQEINSLFDEVFGANNFCIAIERAVQNDFKRLNLAIDLFLRISAEKGIGNSNEDIKLYYRPLFLAVTRDDYRKYQEELRLHPRARRHTSNCW